MWEEAVQETRPQGLTTEDGLGPTMWAPLLQLPRELIQSSRKTRALE